MSSNRQLFSAWTLGSWEAPVCAYTEQTKADLRGVTWAQAKATRYIQGALQLDFLLI